MTFVERPQQRQVIVATMRRNGVAVGLQRLHATMGVDQAADFTPRLGVAAMMVEDADHIRHRRHDRFGLLAIARPQPLQFLSAPLWMFPMRLMNISARSSRVWTRARWIKHTSTA